MGKILEIGGEVFDILLPCIESSHPAYDMRVRVPDRETVPGLQCFDPVLRNSRKNDIAFNRRENFDFLDAGNPVGE
jgi:hypothetical protein